MGFSVALKLHTVVVSTQCGGPLKAARSRKPLGIRFSGRRLPALLHGVEPRWSTCRCMANTAPHGGKGSDACWWRHEEQSVAMALSAAANHNFDKVAAGETYDDPWAQKTDRAGEAANRALQRQKSKAAGEAVIFELFDEDTAGLRPKALAEPRPQELVQRHTMEHIVDFVCIAPMVQILDAPVPQMVEQVPDDVLWFFDRLTTVAEQVIEVPQILPEEVPFRAVLRDTQPAEQLVEVPTIVSYSSLQRIMEQNVDIPVPGRGGRSSGLQGFSRDRIQQRGVLLRNAFLSGLWSRSLTFPVKAFKIFAQDPVHPLLRTFQLVLMKLGPMSLAACG